MSWRQIFLAFICLVLSVMYLITGELTQSSIFGAAMYVIIALGGEEK